MAKKPKASRPPVPKPLRIYKATLGSEGRVIRGAEITEAEAVLERLAERDIVICDGIHRERRDQARRIESAVGPSQRQDPHQNAGRYALPHFQPLRRPPEGHSFYETDRVKAAKNP